MDRGIRNQNPGNIDWHADTTWQGAVGKEPGPTGRFIVFKSPQYGIRAIAKTLLTYQNHDGCKTVRAIINRWAPPVENNTDAYVNSVAAAMSVKPDDPIDVDSVQIMTPLVNAIIAKECTGYVYPAAIVSEALHMAGVADAKPPPLGKQNGFLAQAGSGGALVLAGATQVAQYAAPVKSMADKLSDFTGSPVIQHAVVFLITVAGALTGVGLVADFLKHRST